MYALIINQTVQKYPYSLNELKIDNPQISFPLNLSEELLSSYDVYTVEYKERPNYDIITENLSEGEPQLIDGNWYQTWIVSPATKEEISQRIQEKKIEICKERDRLLLESDWTQLFDVPESTRTLWGLYRQALRDVPQQEGFPLNVIWPIKPG